MLKPWIPDLPIIVLQKGNFSEGAENKEKFFIWDRYLLWKGRPNAVGESCVYLSDKPMTVKFNTLGFRSPEISKVKDVNTFRIFCMGNSTTFGLSVIREEAFPEILRNLLREKFDGKNIEVINSGIPGYSSFQGLVQLKRVILKLKPDLITCCYGKNDALKIPDYVDKDLHQRNISLKGRTREFLLHSKIFVLLENIGIRIRRMINNRDGNSRKAVEQRVPPTDFESNIREIITLSENSNIKPILINHYSVDHSNNEYQSTAYNDIINKVSNEKGITIVDTKEIFREAFHTLHTNDDQRRKIEQLYPESFIVDNISKKVFYMDHCHPTRFGHYIIAQALLENITIPN